jgi:hypothetical protein
LGDLELQYESLHSVEVLLEEEQQAWLHDASLTEGRGPAVPLGQRVHLTTQVFAPKLGIIGKPAKPAL